MTIPRYFWVNCNRNYSIKYLLYAKLNRIVTIVIVIIHWSSTQVNGKLPLKEYNPLNI